jgi:hypothetical protein
VNRFEIDWFMMRADTVVRHLPSPLIAQPYRIPQIWPGTFSMLSFFDNFVLIPLCILPASASDPVRPALMRCESVKPDGAAGPGSGEPSPVMIFVAKMVAVPKSMLKCVSFSLSKIEFSLVYLMCVELAVRNRWRR